MARLVLQVEAMTLIGFLLFILVVGTACWAVQRWPTIPPTFKQIAYVVIVVAAVLYLVSTVSGGGSWNFRLW